MRRRLVRTLHALLGATAVLASPPSRAADPVPYAVTIAPTDNAELDAAAHDVSTLISLRESAPVGAFALIGRARSDRDRFVAALNSQGYYDGRVTITVAGRDLDDPGLADALEAAPAGQDVPVAVTLATGPVFHLRRITLEGDVAPPARSALGLQAGQPARAAEVLAAQGRMLDALRADGHALAKVDTPAAFLDPGAQALDVSFKVESGPRVDLGPIAISGEERLDESYIRRRLRLAPGQRFDPAAIERARRDLAAVPALGSVRIVPSDTLDANGRLPMSVIVSERARRAVTFGAAYSTDQGGNVSASWTHRNLFGEAEQLTLSAAATQLGGTASVQPGYTVGAVLTMPDWQRRGQTLTFNLQALRESLDAYDRTAAIAAATLSRRLGEEWTVGAGPQFEQARITQQGVTRDYTLLQLPGFVQYDTVDPAQIFDPTRGVRVRLSLTPTQSLANSSHANSMTFAIIQLGASAYLDAGAWMGGRDGRTVVALRGLVGGIAGGGSVFEIPPDQRFYAGGGGTIRGYRFQSVGPKFPDNKPTGGTAIAVGTVELRQRIGESWGMAVFADAGQVTAGGSPFAGTVRVGVGAGVRYYTSIGPIRVDVAFPATPEKKGDALEAYIGIGQAF